ncbi:MAG: sugar ABC transporter ATP-binding protein [Clostridium sp.]|nr:sugar ABC transporter ATP-binding protein [Clostridium sp.]
MQSALRLRMCGISKRFPGVNALDNVDFDLRPGEVHALIGENGAGKSTLIKILTGVYQKDSGTITVDGVDTEISSVQDSRRLGIAAIYQEIDFIPIFTVAENIFLGKEPTGVAGKISYAEMRKQAQEVLDSLEAEISAGQVMRELSVGQRQMVMIARALMERSNIIVMDEVTAPLSMSETEKLFAIIEDLRKRGLSIIYISHRMEEIFKVADRVTVLRDGCMVGSRNIEETDVDELIRLMVGREMRDMYPKEEVPISDEEVLRVEGLSRGNAVRNVSFSVRKGEILGLGGLVGAGRSEVARLLCGIDQKDAGEIYLEGKRVDIRSSGDAVKAGIALIPEDRRVEGLVLDMDVTENVTLARLKSFCLGGIIPKVSEEKRHASDLVDTLSIRTPSLSQRVKYLSGGNQQKVVLGKWLSKEAKVFIFDEPTKGVDVGAKREIYSLMGDLVREGAAIILISSDLPELLALSDRILVMHRGETTGELSRDEATGEKVLYYATSGR